MHTPQTITSTPRKSPQGHTAARRVENGRDVLVIDLAGATHASVVRSVEAELFAHALERAGGNRKAAAAAVGMGYRTFLNRLALLPLRFSVTVE